MNDYLNKGLVGLIRSKIRAAQRKGEPWTVPPDSAFENAMAEISSQSTANNRRWVMPLLLLLCLAGFIVGAITLVDHLHGLNSKIENLESQVSNLKDVTVSGSTGEAAIEEEVIENNGTNTVGQGVIDQPSQDNAPDKPLKVERSQVQSNIIQVLSSEFTSKTIAERSNQTGLNATSQQSIDSIHKSDPATEISSSVSSEENLPRTDAHTPTHTVPAVAMTGVFKEIITIPVGNADLTASSTKGFAIRASVNANASTLSMRNIPDGEPLLTEYDKYYWGGGATVSAEYQFTKRLALVGGIGFNLLTSRSHLYDNHKYNSDNIILDSNGEPVYSASTMIETPFGWQADDIEFYTASSGIQDGEKLAKDALIDQEFQIWDFSAGIAYDVLQKDRLSIALGAGGTYSIIGKSTHDMDMDVMYGGEAIAKLQSTHSAVEKMANSFFSLYVEADVRYQITHKTAISMAFRYSRSVTSLREADGTEPVTHLQQIAPSIGFVYSLNH